MKSRDLVLHWIELYNVEDIDWKKEMSIAKKLLSKYSDEDISYVLQYYKDRGNYIYSLGFFVFKNYKFMSDPIKERKAELNCKGDDDSGERNRRKLEQNNKTNNRTKLDFSMFEES